MIDNEVEETKEVTLDGLSSEAVTFSASRSTPGLYLVSVNGMPGSFSVIDSVVVEDTEDAPPAFTQINGPAFSPAPPRTTSWWIIGSIYTADAILLIIIVMWLVKRRRKAKQTENEQLILSYDLQMPDDKELRE